jgi:hypothetical protein
MRAKVKNETPDWLNSNFINLAEVARLLLGGDAITKIDKYYLKKSGNRSWRPDELERLEEIRKDIIKELGGRPSVRVK